MEASSRASEEAASDVIGEGGGATKANADPRRRRGRSSCRSERWRLLLSIIFIGDVGWEGEVSKYRKIMEILQKGLTKNTKFEVKQKHATLDTIIWIKKYSTWH